MRQRQRLTPRETRVAQLVVDGGSTPDVARKLGVSPKTVEAHLFRVYRKLGVRSRDELATQLEAPLGRASSKDEPQSPFSSNGARANNPVTSEEGDSR